MTPEHAFLDSIWEDLDDDATKLIFADWLEEQEDWRGQLLRLQVERNQHGFWTSRFKGLHGRIGELLQERGADWLRPLGLERHQVRYSDGTGLLWLFLAPQAFARLSEPRHSEGVQRWVTEVSLTGKYLNDLLTALERGPTVRVFVNLSGEAPQQVGRKLANCRGLDRLRSLDLTYSRLAPRDLETLLAAPALEGLQYLFLGYSTGTSGVPAALVQARHLTHLRGLDLSRGHLTDSELERLGRASCLAGLRALYLEQNQFTPRGLDCLLTSPHLNNLRVLDLRECHLNYEWPILDALRQRFPALSL